MIKLIGHLIFSLFAMLMFTMPVQAEVSQARIIKVVDGDTVKVRDLEGLKYLVSLSGVDAPEVSQAQGKAAKDYLCSVICGKDVVINFNKLNTEGHVLAVMYLGDTEVNLKMLEGGMAWQDFHDMEVVSGTRNQRYAHAESNARRQGAGLWQDDLVISPWRYREISQVSLWD